MINRLLKKIVKSPSEEIVNSPPEGIVNSPPEGIVNSPPEEEFQDPPTTLQTGGSVTKGLMPGAKTGRKKRHSASGGNASTSLIAGADLGQSALNELVPQQQGLETALNQVAKSPAHSDAEEIKLDDLSR
ncbi:hypothetical protein Tco_1243929 [Tanacetum coccineum]